MKNIKLISLLLMAAMLFNACDSEEDEHMTTATGNGSLVLKFGHVAGAGINLSASEVGDTAYKFTNAQDQEYSVTVLKYLISAIKLAGPNGASYEEELEVTADDAKGYYLVNLKAANSQTISLEGIPAGSYNQVTFTVGVDSSGVAEGAAGGVLSQTVGPKDADMFWNWNAGYQSLKLEGQSPVIPNADAFGESITETDTGYTFHIGGWSSPNNNKAITLDITEVEVTEDGNAPQVHLVLDMSELLKEVDFRIMYNIHSPAAGEGLANAIPNAFKFDHIH